MHGGNCDVPFRHDQCPLYPPKADMCCALRVRYVPIADMETLFDQLIGAQQKTYGNSVVH